MTAAQWTRVSLRASHLQNTRPVSGENISLLPALSSLLLSAGLVEDVAHSQMVQRRLKKLADRLWCADKLVQRVGRNEGQQLAALSEIWLWNLASCDWVCVLNDTCTTNQQDTCLTDTTNASISPKILWLDVHFYAQHCGCRSAHSFQQKSEIFFLFFGKKPKNLWIQIKHVRKPLRVNYSI